MTDIQFKILLRVIVKCATLLMSAITEKGCENYYAREMYEYQYKVLKDNDAVPTPVTPEQKEK